MIALAAVLLLIVIVFTVAVVVSNPTVFDLSIFGAGVPVTTAGVYFTGAGAMLVLVLGAELLRRGVKRDVARRRQVRALQKAAGVKSLPTTARKPTATRPAAEVSKDAPTGVRSAATPRPAKPEPTSEPTNSEVAERQALLDEAEELTGDSADR